MQACARLARGGRLAEPGVGGCADDAAVLLAAVGDRDVAMPRGGSFDVAGVPAVIDLEQVEEPLERLRRPHGVGVGERHGDSLRSVPSD